MNGADKKIMSYSGAVDYGTLSNNSVRFNSNGSEKMRITSAGNVGIGVTNPGAKLDVVGTMSVDGDSTFQQLIKAPNMQNYANNNDALLAGLQPGTLYHTNGTVKIVI